MACSSNTCTTRLLSVVFKSSEKWKWWRWPVEWVEREETATRLNLIITSPSLHHHFIIICGHPGHPDSHHYLAVVTRGLHQTLPSLHHLLIITSPSHTRGHLGNPDNHTIIISSHTSHRHLHQHHGSRHGDEADTDLDIGTTRTTRVFKKPRKWMSFCLFNRSFTQNPDFPFTVI